MIFQLSNYSNNIVDPKPKQMDVISDNNTITISIGILNFFSAPFAYYILICFVQHMFLTTWPEMNTLIQTQEKTKVDTEITKTMKSAC